MLACVYAQRLRWGDLQGDVKGVQGGPAMEYSRTLVQGSHWDTVESENLGFPT